MKKLYCRAELDVSMFSEVDVILTSDNGEVDLGIEVPQDPTDFGTEEVTE